MPDLPSRAERPTHVMHWPEWRLVRAAEQRGGPPYVAALAHWATWRGRWLAARERGDFAGMLRAELKAERHARTMRNALRWHGEGEEAIAATMAAHRRVTDAVMGGNWRSHGVAPRSLPILEFVRQLRVDARSRWAEKAQGRP